MDRTEFDKQWRAALEEADEVRTLRTRLAEVERERDEARNTTVEDKAEIDRLLARAERAEAEAIEQRGRAVEWVNHYEALQEQNRLLLETLRQVREREAGMRRAATALLDNGPFPDDLRMLIAGVGGSDATRSAAMQLADDFHARREELRAALAPAPATEGERLTLTATVPTGPRRVMVPAPSTEAERELRKCARHSDCKLSEAYDDCAPAPEPGCGLRRLDCPGCADCRCSTPDCDRRVPMGAKDRRCAICASKAAPEPGGERDCGSNSCRYAKRKGGMRTNGHCRCDQCPECGRASALRFPQTHRDNCSRRIDGGRHE